MKLYELPRNSQFRLTNCEKKEVFNFHHLDGMYSLCTTDKEQMIFHLAAWTKVEKVD